MLRTPRLPRAVYAIETLEPRRLLAIGVDPSFGELGIARVEAGVDHYHGTVMVRELADGKILTVTGVGLNRDQGGTGIYAAVARFYADGMVDTTFGDGDGVTLVFMGGHVAEAMLQPDGKVVIVGQSGDFDRIRVARMTADGILDETFAGDGVAEVTAASGDEGLSVWGGALSPDGSIVASGAVRVGDDSHLVLARFTLQGNPLTTFGGDGLVIENRPGFADYAQVAVDANNRVLVAVRENDRALVGRFTTAGAVDATFGDDGGARGVNGSRNPQVAVDPHALTAARRSGACRCRT